MFPNNLIFLSLRSPSSQTEDDNQKMTSRDKDGTYLRLASGRTIQPLVLSLPVSTKFGENVKGSTERAQKRQDTGGLL